jgi:DNA-binding response OmpR family regulator
MKRIVFVEDDPGTLESLQIIFDPTEFEVILYSNGHPILENQTAIPDLYILDKQLSGVDGLDICRHLKSQESTRHIPVIILSASPHVHQLASAAGADNTLEKPFSVQALRDLVRQLLMQK